MGVLERLFGIRSPEEVKREFRAALATFMTMAYIVVVNPSILSDAGMDPGAVMVATVIASAVATFLMGVYANFPFALAPGMGLNAYFTYTVVRTLGYSWQEALGGVFISGVLFLILALTGLREKIVDSVPVSLKAAISSGVGFFITVIGLHNARIINFEGLPSLGEVSSPSFLLAMFGLLLIALLLVLRVRGAIIIGIILTWLVGAILGYAQLPRAVFGSEGVFSLPPSLAPTFMKLDIAGALSRGALSFVFTFFFVDFFDTAGTLIGLGFRGGFIDRRTGKFHKKYRGESSEELHDVRYPRIGRAFITDAVGTITGALLGTSTVTTYVESAAGLEEGGKTGLTALFVSLFFIITLFLYPLVSKIPSWATAPALIMVGLMMMHSITKIPLNEYDEAVPAFLTVVSIPLTYSIATGLALGFTSYVIIKLLAGFFIREKWRDLNPVLVVLSVLFVIFLAMK